MTHKVSYQAIKQDGTLGEVHHRFLQNGKVSVAFLVFFKKHMETTHPSLQWKKVDTGHYEATLEGKPAGFIKLKKVS